MSLKESIPRGLYRRGKTFLVSAGAFGLSDLALSWQYTNSKLFPAGSDADHLKAALGWLCQAQDAVEEGGVSAVFRLGGGWDVPYPETSGYIIPTFLACQDYLEDDRLLDRARRIGDWEISIQSVSGGIRSRPGLDQTRIFNTGQVILGWCALYERTKEEKLLNAACRAGDYLVRLQEPDGRWIQDTYCGPRTYHARVDWALLRLAELSGDSRYRETARKNIRWTLQQLQSNGWFQNCGFHEADPITHIIDYTLIGLLESVLLDPSICEQEASVLLAPSASAICTIIENVSVRAIPGMIPASFGSNWESHDEYSCLTGNAQLAYTLLRLYGLTQNARYERCAKVLIAALKHSQAIGGVPPEVQGGIAGSFPIYSGYLPNSFPNWAAKFFADALLMSLLQKSSFVVKG